MNLDLAYGPNNSRIQFERDGILFPMDVLAPAEVAQVLAALDRLQQAPAAVRTSLLAHKSHLVSRVLHDLLRHPNILRHVQPLLGSDVLAWGSDFFIKDADSPNFVSWHQDATYWGLIPDDVVTAWIALIPSTVLSGCLQVIPGTHRLALMPHRPTFAPHNMLSRGQTIESGLKQEQAADIVLAPGQMSLHHVKIAHASGPNRSVERRVGFAIRYIGAHVRQEGRNTDTATLVSGANRSGNFILEPAPKGELVPEDIAFHQASWAAEQYAIEVTKQR